MVVIKSEKGLPVPPTPASTVSQLESSSSYTSPSGADEDDAPPEYENDVSSSAIATLSSMTASSSSMTASSSSITTNASSVTTTAPAPHPGPISIPPPDAARLPNTVINTSPRNRASNFIRVSNSLAGVQGTWTIDTSIHVPESLLPKKSKSKSKVDEPHANFQAKTSIGSIDATVQLVGEHEKATIRLSSSTGPIDCAVRKEPAQKIDLKATSSIGNIALYLPRTFSGFVTLSGKIGNIRYSTAVMGDLVQMNQIKGKRMHYLSSAGHDGSVFDQYDSWTGDLLHAESSVGKVSIFYEDEKRGPERKDSAGISPIPLPAESPVSATTLSRRSGKSLSSPGTSAAPETADLLLE